MTFIAQSNNIIKIKPEIGVISPRFDVVCVQSFVILFWRSTSLASVVISGVDSLEKLKTFLGAVESLSLGSNPALPRRVFGSNFPTNSGSACIADRDAVALEPTKNGDFASTTLFSNLGSSFIQGYVLVVQPLMVSIEALFLVAYDENSPTVFGLVPFNGLVASTSAERWEFSNRRFSCNWFTSFSVRVRFFWGAQLNTVFNKNISNSFWDDSELFTKNVHASPSPVLVLGQILFEYFVLLFFCKAFSGHTQTPFGQMFYQKYSIVNVLIQQGELA